MINKISDIGCNCIYLTIALPAVISMNDNEKNRTRLQDKGKTQV
jgi:hypothetical protein